MTSVMNMKSILTFGQKTGTGAVLRRALLLALLGLTSVPTAHAVLLEGQNKGDTNWTSVNLQGWAELDYIPCRFNFGSGTAGAQSITINFPHLGGTTPGFEDLTGFSPATANLTFLSAPALSINPSGVWSYTFTVQISDANPAQVRFFARMASGAHLNGGSSLQLKSSAGNVQIHDPTPTPGIPDLAIVAAGNATASPGSTVSYSLSYTNRASTNALGVQVSQILPVGLNVDTNSLGANAHLTGNTIFWDIGNLNAGNGGTVSFTGLVDPLAAPGSVLTNYSQILSSQNDANMADNSFTIITAIGCSGATPTIVSSPVSVLPCPGDGVIFSVGAASPSAVTYQWRKDGSPLAGQTDSTCVLVGVSSADEGAYDVVVSNPCGSATSAAASLNLNPGWPLTITHGAFQPDGTFLLKFGTTCTGTYFVQYSADLVNWKTTTQGVNGSGAEVQWIDSGSPVTDSMPSPEKARFYRIIRVP